MNTLHDIIEWVRSEGEVQAENRIRMRVLPLTVKEGLIFSKIGPSTQASRELVEAIREEATIVVGKPYLH